MSSPIDIPNGLKIRIRHMEVQKKAKELWSKHGKNYSREELSAPEVTKYLIEMCVDIVSLSIAYIIEIYILKKYVFY